MDEAQRLRLGGFALGINRFPHEKKDIPAPDRCQELKIHTNVESR
jgi:hypothetical protein